MLIKDFDPKEEVLTWRLKTSDNEEELDKLETESPFIELLNVDVDKDDEKEELEASSEVVLAIVELEKDDVAFDMSYPCFSFVRSGFR